MTATSYAIALGANVRSRWGSPERTVRRALGMLGPVTAVSPIFATRPIGPSRRRFANAVAIVVTDESPPDLLTRLQRIERTLGRRRGRRWAARVIDLDIILWSGGSWRSPGLIVPHPAFRDRAFVLRPLDRIAPAWRDPITGRTVRQLAHMVDRPRPRS